MRKSILYAFLFVFLSFTLISCGMGNTVDETASNTTPDASKKELLSISAVSMGKTSYKFTPNISGASASELTYEWNFGDAESSTDQSPTHVYQSLGMKTVTLTTYKGEDIWKTTSTAINVTDSGSITGTDIIAKPTTNDVSYTFTSRAVAANGDDLEFSWNFDDGSETIQTGTNLNNVNHVFSQYGRDYNVVLTVTNKTNGDTTKTETLVSIPEPTLSFSVTSGSQAGSKIFLPSLTINIPDVTYTWDFGDGTDKLTSSTSSPSIEHYYAKGSVSNNLATVTCTATSDYLAKPIVVTVENINVAINFQLFDASNVVTSNDKLSFKYSVKGAFLETDAENGGTVSYRFTFADGTVSDLILGTSVSDESGQVIAGQTYAEVTHTYGKYYRNYIVKVEAIQTVSGKESSLGVLSEGLSHNYTAPVIELVPTTDENNPFSVSFTANGAEGFYPLKDAVYAWNFGDGPEEEGSFTASHEYKANGTFNVSLRVSSTLVDFENAYTVRTTVNINESLSNVRIQCSGTTVDTWLTYNCTTAASSSTGTLEYIWKIDGVVQNNNTATLRPVFTKYNESHNIDLTVRIAGTSISADAERWVINTPVASLDIEGSQSVLSGVSSNYTLKFKITRGSESKYIDLTNPTVIWKFNNTQNPSYNNKMSISHTFTVNPNTEGKTVVRRVYNEVRSSNLNGFVSKETPVTVTYPESGMGDIQNVEIICENDSAWNPVKKKCYVDFDFKAGVLDQDKTKFKFSIKDTNNWNQPKVGVAGGTYKADLVLRWADNIVTGNWPSRNVTLTADLYKPDKPNNKTTVTKVAVVNSYGDYVLFPLPTSETNGGTGNRIGVFSCGYNSFYSEGQGRITSNNPECNEGNSASGKTLNLGPLMDSNGNALVAFTMNWKVRIPNVGERKITSATVQKGKSIPDGMKKFTLDSAFNGVKYAGDVYNSNNSNNMFFLEITDAVSQPLRIWYNGNNKTDKGNRLRILAPIQETSGHSCGYRISGKTIYAQNVTVKFREPYFNNGSNNFGVGFSGTYVTNTNQSRTFGGGGFPSVNTGNRTVGIQMLQYTEGDNTVSSITRLTDINLSVYLQNSLYSFGSSTYEYKNVYKGISCQ